MRSNRFLITRKRTSLLVRARLISAISFTLRPRYSDTIIVRALASSSRSSATVARLASVGMCLLRERHPSALGSRVVASALVHAGTLGPMARGASPRASGGYALAHVL